MDVANERTSGPWPDACQFTGCSERPSSKAAASDEARRTLRYVEPLSAARTLLADFLNGLLFGLEPGDRDRSIGQTHTVRRPLSHRMPQPGSIVAGGKI